jgi:tRNA G18 (ribose-2'-O)-methylase SpoU
MTVNNHGRGFFEIGIYHGKFEENLGTLWRSAYQMGAAGIFTIGHRYSEQCSDTTRAWRHIPLRNFPTWESFQESRPHATPLVGVEFGGEDLAGFVHPQRAIYLLGAEDHGLPPDILEACQYRVSIETLRSMSYNVAVAGSLVMYSRMTRSSRLA